MAQLPAGVPRPPTKPEDSECCHRHCDPCIMDYYDTALERWRGIVEARGLDPDKVLASFERPEPGA